LPICGGLIVIVQDFLVVLRDNGMHIGGAAVAQFDCGSIKNFVVPVGLWKVLVNEGEKSFTNVCFDLYVEWRVVPDDIAPPPLFCS
jgi:hypothetical protein